MPQQFQVYFSNRSEVLYHRLKEQLFNPQSSPFAKRMIIVPSPPMKSWLMLQMAKDPELGIATGVEISYLDQTLKRLQELLVDKSPPEQKSFSHLELALHIETEIRHIILRQAALQDEERKLLQPLLDYLKIGPLSNTISRKSARRLIALSEKLAFLFTQYSNYGGSLLTEWETQTAAGWQQQLWRQLALKWNYPYRSISSVLAQPIPQPVFDIQLHLFSMSFLPRLQHGFCTHLAQAIPVNYYLLSPCQAFWSDVVSDRQSRHIEAYWKKRGVSEAQQIALEEYLRDRNPLLANFGRLGREMAQQIEESEAETDEVYVLPHALVNHPQYDELFSPDDTLFHSIDQPLTLLSAIQADMTLLRNPEGSPRIEFTENDGSVQVHMASNRMREVQILYDAILAIIEKHSHDETPIFPQDVLVMAPDIAEYAPFIKAVFGAHESVLEAQITDLQMTGGSSLVQAFLHLLTLPFSRWDVSAILQLFDYPAFQRQHSFTLEEIHTIQGWTKSAGVRWGTDHSHRNELLKRDHCPRGMVEETPFGTWEYAVDRLLSGLTMSCGDEEAGGALLPLLPLENVDSTRAELLGRWISLLRALRNDLRRLNDGSQHTLKEWAEYLRSLYSNHFAIDLEEYDEAEHQKALWAQIEAFESAASTLAEEKFSFTTIKRHLEAALNKQSSSYREQCLHAVHFCSLLPMRAIPSQVVALLGMEEGAFPKYDAELSMNLLSSNPQADYCPSRTDFDRFLFLEALLSARKYAVITYQGYSSNDGKEQPPSLVVTELLAYMDRAYAIDEKKTSLSCLRKHPYHAFDKSYFEADSDFRSYSLSNYKAAAAYYHVEKTSPHRFVPEFRLEQTQAWQSSRSVQLKHLQGESYSQEIRVSLKDLNAMARNPVQSYFNKTLGIYLEKAEDRVWKNEEDFEVSTLQAYQLKKMALSQPVDIVLRWAEKQGHLPLGAFKSVAIDRIQKEISSLKSNLDSYGVDPREIFEIEFSEQCRQPERLSATQWQVPALQVHYRDDIRVKIVGTIPEVSSQGLIAHIKDNKEDVVKAWPHFLVLACLAKRDGLAINDRLLMLKSDKGKAKEAFFEDPQQLLRHYLDYYFAALEHPSPLIPEIVPLLLNGEIEEKLSKTINNPHKQFYNDYVKWMVRSGVILDSKSMELHWQEVARRLFEELYQNWYPEKAEG